MNSETILNKILDQVRTKEDINALKEGLEALAKPNESPRKIFAEKFPGFLGNIFLDGHAQGFSEESLCKIGETANKALKKAPILQVELGYEPSEEGVLQFSEWARSNVAKNAILDIICDRSILGGARIYYQGKFFERTLEKIVENFLEKEVKENILA